MEVQRKRLWIVYQFVYRQSIYRSNPNYQHTNLMRFLSCCTPLINKSFLLMVRKHNILQSYIYQIFYLFCFIIIKMQKSKSCTSLIWTLFLQKKSKLRRQFIAYFGMLVVNDCWHSRCSKEWFLSSESQSSIWSKCLRLAKMKNLFVCVKN